MERLLLARHGESQLSAQGLVNGDPDVPCPLTAAGREQARELGEALRDERIDLCVVTEFERVRETAELALTGRDVPMIVVPQLNDPRYGEFEGGRLDTYRVWVWERGPLEAPPGGEHRGELAARYAHGLRALLERTEESVLVVGHSLPIRYALDAAKGLSPRARVDLVEYATAYPLTVAQVRRAAALLGTWSQAPVF